MSRDASLSDSYISLSVASPFKHKGEIGRGVLPGSPEELCGPKMKKNGELKKMGENSKIGNIFCLIFHD